MQSQIRVVGEQVAGVGRLMLDAAFPPRCPSCQVPVAGLHHFCPDCFQQLKLISAPHCARCGIPFVVAIDALAECPECLAEPPSFARARAVMVYDAISAPLVSALKFHDQWTGLARFTEMMAVSGRALLQEADLLVPVPLHWRRLWWRKYNQAALLAHGLGAHSGLPVRSDILQRQRATTPQMRLPRAERLKNVKNVFAVRAGAISIIEGKHIVLVDDVITTGATVAACSTALLHAGAASVQVLALARTVKE